MPIPRASECVHRARHAARILPRETSLGGRVHLVQVLLPVYDNRGARLPPALYQRLAAELTEVFGGVTTYTRAPAEGLWKDGGRGTSHDEIVIYEVMAKALDAEWWAGCRARLEQAFAQERIVIRAHEVRLL